MTKTQEHKTANGIVKGRPGAGKVLSLGERKTCYAGHKMTKDNTFTYTRLRRKLENGRVDPKDHPSARIWCRICRAISRKGSHVRRVAAEALEQRKASHTARATVEAGMSKGKARKARPAPVKASVAKAVAKAKPVAKPKAVASTPKTRAATVKAKARKHAPAPVARKAKAAPAPKGKAAPAPKGKAAPKAVGTVAHKGKARKGKAAPAPEIVGVAATARKQALAAGNPPPLVNQVGGS